MGEKAEIVICGAGIAGISTAYALAVRHGWRDILLVDERDPLSLTSDKSSECYRNWWPGPGNAMVALMNRSIDLMEELASRSGNRFNLNRRGYLYLTADPGRLPALQAAAGEISALGAGPLRLHTGSASDPAYLPAPAEGFAGQPDGADLILDPAALHRCFPYLTPRAVAGLHVRRAGWFSAQQLGVYLLEQARAAGVRLLRGRLSSVDTSGGRVQGACLADGTRLHTPRLVDAAGPLSNSIAQMLGRQLPVFSELHMKLAFRDDRGVLPREAPLLIWNDPQRLPWTAEERQALAEDEDTAYLLGELPPGAHTRPEGGAGSPINLMLWEYRTRKLEPGWPLPLDPMFPEVVLRGLATMLPGLRLYLDRPARPIVDGGYYTKTRENRPLIGPLPVEGAYVLGALSGFGLMAACAAGELLGAHIVGEALPSYASAFLLERYEDPDYLRLLDEAGDSGQL